MEDVIFSGTSNLPSKNISEVALLLDNQEKAGLLNIITLMKYLLNVKLKKIKVPNII